MIPKIYLYWEKKSKSKPTPMNCPENLMPLVPKPGKGLNLKRFTTTSKRPHKRITNLMVILLSRDLKTFHLSI
jgi:hypothetical protein